MPMTKEQVRAAADNPNRKTIAAERVAKIDAALWQIHEVVMDATNGERGDMWGFFNSLKDEAIGIKTMLIK